VLADLRRPELRTGVTLGLFLLYFVLFYLFWGPLSAGLRWLWANALPGEEGLQTIFTLISVGTWLVKRHALLDRLAAALGADCHHGPAARVATSLSAPERRLHRGAEQPAIQQKWPTHGH
jgi:hypothetical protein